jgi:uncharacterized protein (DUF885 family)
LYHSSLKNIPAKQDSPVKLSLKQWLLAIVLLAGFCSAVFFFYSQHHGDARFEQFAEDFFLQELSSDPIQFHYSIENPAAYGIEEAALTLPVYQPGTAADTVYELAQLRSSLRELGKTNLNDSDRYLYKLLDSYLTLSAKTAAYPYFQEPLSPSSGAVSELPILLAEYRLSSKEDIELYFSILSQIPDYFDGLVTFEKEKAAAGLFMSDESADKVIRQCVDLMDAAALQDGSHFLEATFASRLQELADGGVLTAKELPAYQSENDRLIQTVVAPAYDALADELTLLKGSGQETGGLAGYLGGRDYYTALVHLRTGSGRSMEEIKQLLYEDLQLNYESLTSLVESNSSLQALFSEEQNFLPDMTAEEILSYLEDTIAGEYPTWGSVQAEKTAAFTGTSLQDQADTGDDISCTIKYVDASLEPYSAPAFYMVPPIDNASENTIYINAMDTSEGLSLFTTLAHEGYPGHLYQTVYSQKYMKQAGITPLRSLLYYGGFTEGWAVYAELSSYDYAIALASVTHPEAAAYYQACRLDRQIQLGFYSLLDVAIHYDGMSLDEMKKLFASLGSYDEDSVCSVYEYIAEEPANYLKYYLGYLEILELKKQAADLWYGNDQTVLACENFNDHDFCLRFNRFLLENGPADYTNLALRLPSG